MAFFFCFFVLIAILATVLVRHKIRLSLYVAADYGFSSVEVRIWGVLVAKARFYIIEEGVFLEFFGKIKKITVKSGGQNERRNGKKKKFFPIKAVLKAAKINEISAYVFGGFSDSYKTALILGAINSVLAVAKSAGGVKVKKTVVPSGGERFFGSFEICIKLSVWDTLTKIAEGRKCQTTSRKSSKIRSTP